jgi:hypothetical protein
VQAKRPRKNSKREGSASAVRAGYRHSEKRSTDMNEPSDLNALIQVLNPAAAAKQAKDEAEAWAKEAKKRAEEAKEEAKKIEKKANEKAETKAREAKLSDNDQKHLTEIISLFNDLERHGVLSYRVEAPVEGKPRVLRFAIKNGQPIIITLSSKQVTLEKLRPNGSWESVKASGISKPSELTKSKMMNLIDGMLEE